MIAAIVTASLLLAAIEAQSGGAKNPTIVVRVEGGWVATNGMLQYAEELASEILEEGGVDVVWCETANCTQPAHQSMELLVRLTTEVPPEERPGSLATASPYSNGRSAILIMYDRLTASTRLRGPRFRATFLAHVMAHEITHMLQRVARHSDFGLMRKTWTTKDLLQMERESLPFAPEDRYLIRRGLEDLLEKEQGSVNTVGQ